MGKYKEIAIETSDNCNLTNTKKEGNVRIYLEPDNYVWFASWKNAYCWLCGYETAMNKHKK